MHAAAWRWRYLADSSDLEHVAWIPILLSSCPLPFFTCRPNAWQRTLVAGSGHPHCHSTWCQLCQCAASNQHPRRSRTRHSQGHGAGPSAVSWHAVLTVSGRACPLSASSFVNSQRSCRPQRHGTWCQPCMCAASFLLPSPSVFQVVAVAKLTRISRYAVKVPGRTRGSRVGVSA